MMNYLLRVWVFPAGVMTSITFIVPWLQHFPFGKPLDEKLFFLRGDRGNSPLRETKNLNPYFKVNYSAIADSGDDFAPLAPQFWGEQNSKSPSKLGDLGGFTKTKRSLKQTSIQQRQLFSDRW